MDHLPYHPNPDERPLLIPYICGYEIEPLNRSRTVVSEQIISTSARAFLGALQGRSWHEEGSQIACSTAQAYLYFGLLHDVFAEFCVRIRAADFVEYSEDAGCKVVSLRKLESMVGRLWKDSRGYFKDGDRISMRTIFLSNVLGEAEKIRDTSDLEKIWSACLFRRSCGPRGSSLVSSLS